MSILDIYTYEHRSLYDILSDIKNCHKTRNYSYLDGLLAELECQHERLEASVKDAKLVDNAVDTLNKIKREVADLEEKKKRLR